MKTEVLLLNCTQEIYDIIYDLEFSCSPWRHNQHMYKFIKTMFKVSRNMTMKSGETTAAVVQGAEVTLSGRGDYLMLLWLAVTWFSSYLVKVMMQSVISSPFVTDTHDVGILLDYSFSAGECYVWPYCQAHPLQHCILDIGIRVLLCLLSCSKEILLALMSFFFLTKL